MDIATIILNLRGLADWIEKHPQRPLPTASCDVELIRLAASQLEIAKAAPDMLEALRKIAKEQSAKSATDAADRFQEIARAAIAADRFQEIARAAIAKATGEPQT